MLKFVVILVIFGLVKSEGEDIEAVFECNFEDDECGLTNQAGLTTKWVRKEMDIGGRKGNVMALEGSGKGKQLGRLLTPYFEIQRQLEACLSFDMYMHGEGALRFRVEEQNDSGFRKLLSSSTVVSGWRSYSLDIDIDEYVRFLFEGLVDPDIGKSTIAVDNFVLKLQKCPPQ